MSASYQGPDCDLVPDTGAIKAFVSWWFQYCTKGVIEIGWLDAQGRGLIHFEQFARDDLDALTATAIQANLVPGQACYIRAATVMPWGAQRRTTDMDFEQAPGIWSDIDTQADLERARTIKTLLRPNGSVITGTIPHMRAQSWFLCSDPIASPDLVRSLNVRLQKLFGGDSAVVNPSRLMRLPGTIAWPWKDGRVPEVTQFVRPPADDPRPASYPLALLTSQLPQDKEDTNRPTIAGERATLNSVSEWMRIAKLPNQWHDAVLKLTGHWVSRGWSTAEIVAICQTLTMSGYSERQTEAEVLKMVHGARLKYGVEPPEPVIGGSEDTGFGSAILDPWGAMTPPAFPVGALPPVLRNFVEDRARTMGADACGLAWSALSACSSALHGGVRLRMKKHDTWSVPPALWVALIGPSSSKKTPIIDSAWGPLREPQGRALRAWQKQMADYHRLSKEDKKDTDPPSPPHLLFVNDSTIESIQEILSRQDRGVGVIKDELSGFIDSMDRYSKGGKGGGDRAFYLQAHNGGPQMVTRVGKGMLVINNLLLTLCGGIQPDSLAKFTDLMDDGLWQRFLPIIVAALGMGLDEAPTRACEDYALRLQGLVDAAAPETVVSLSDGANQVRQTIEVEMDRLERLSPLGGKFASFTGKLPGIFGRLCLVLSYVDPHGLGYIVSKETAEMACALINDSVIPNAVQVYLRVGGTGSVSIEKTQAIASFILTHKSQRIVVSDVTSGVASCRNLTVGEISLQLSPLVAGGWLKPESETPSNRAWIVNPAVHPLMVERTRIEVLRKEERARLHQTRNHQTQQDNQE